MNKKIVSFVLLAAAVGGIGAVSASQGASAQTATSILKPFAISNPSSANAITINQKTSVGEGRASAGALLLDNSGNDHTGLTVYTNAGGSASQPLVRMEVDNPAWTEEVLYIRSDSATSRGLIRLDSPAPEIEFVETDQKGAAGKFEVRVQHDEFQINSRLSDDSGFENKISMTHEGDLELEKGTLNVKGSAPATFAGGINITGGCLAVNGKCVSANGSGATTASAPAAASSVQVVSGPPSAISCNSQTERGALALDTKNNRFYVCNGTERGWDYYTLTD